MDTIDPKTKSNVIFSTIHYMLTFVFFFLILINSISLTIAISNMQVNSDDENAVKAKNLMIAAVSVAFIGEALILIFLGVAYLYQSNQSELTRSYYEELMEKTGGENLYAAMRIVSFSILMFISLVLSALCLEAATLINESDDPNQYDSEYNLCEELGKTFMLHFILFSVIQGGSYIYQLFYNNDIIKIAPGSLVMGKDD